MTGRIALAVLSATLLIVSFPGHNIGMCAWVALIPLFFALDGLKPLKAFIISYLAGSVFFLGTIYWLIHVTLPGMAAVALYLALYFGLFGLLVSALNTHYTLFTALFIFPAVWVVCEWLRSNVLTGFCWALLAHSQALNPTAIQIADLTGAYGVSFLIVLVNAAIFLTIRGMRKKRYDVAYLMVAITLVFLSTAYGIVRLKNVFHGEPLKVAVVQGNIPQTLKWDQRFRQEILNKYDRLTREAAGMRPDLIVWPETSVPGFVEDEPALFARVSGLAKGLNTPILAGSPRVDEGAEGVLYNSAILFGRDGRVLGRYDKNHLVPFGEYVPFKKVFSFVERFAHSPIGDFSPGRDMTALGFFVERSSGTARSGVRLLKRVRFSALICFEDIFPDLSRRAVANGANFLVNMTNDAWFMDSGAPYQHAASSVFRAVENRVNVIRAANTGYSCFIDQKGEVAGSVEASGRHLFVDGYAVRAIVLSRARTFYNRYGDVFAYLCGAFAAFCIFAAMVKKERKEQEEEEERFV